MVRIGEEVLTRVVHMIADQKNMLKVFLSINGIFLINWLPPGRSSAMATSMRNI
jgi:hypothetical protein